MQLKIIIKHRYTDAVLFEYEPTLEQRSNGTAMRAALEAAARGGANLEGANLEGANLRSANLRGMNLRGMKLIGADLRGANLRGADLYAANLDGANLDTTNLGGAYLRGAYLGGLLKLIGERPIFSVGPIGSRCDFFSAYITDDGLRLRAGCFFGTIPEFEEKLQAEHGDNVHAREYRAALELIKAHAELWTPAPEEGKTAEVGAND